MIINKSVATKVLESALSTGGDFAEIFAEDTLSSSIRMIDNVIETALSGKLYGAGIRIFKGLKSVYATTNDLSENGLILCAKKAATVIGELKSDIEVVLSETKVTNIHPIKLFPSDVTNKRKADLVKSAYASSKNYSDEIIQTSVYFGDTDQNIFIANSDGIYTSDRRVYNRIAVSSVASDGTENQVGFEGPGNMKGFETFEKDIDVDAIGKSSAKQAITMLHAKDCPSGQMTVAIENGFGGVIFHEACGHSLEATSVSKKSSEFTGRLGEVIANEKVTAIDDGTLSGEWGSINIDDEGTKSQRNVLIENGVLKGYLIDKMGGRHMDMPITGSSRRQSYQFAPTSRMTNTYIDNGPDKNEDIIKSIENGIYAKRMGGGSVNPATGEFNFAVSEGYLVKNGEIGEPIRGACLIGKGSEILKNIDMVGQNLAFGTGMCGSMSGSIPVNVGQPLIRVSNIIVGGK